MKHIGITLAALVGCFAIVAVLWTECVPSLRTLADLGFFVGLLAAFGLAIDLSNDS